MDPLQLPEKSLCPSMFLTSSILPELVFVCLTTSTCFYGVKNDNSFGTFNCPPGMTWWRLINSPRHTPEIFPCFHGVATSSRSLQIRLLLAKSLPCALQKVTTPLTRCRRALSPRRSSRLSGGVRFDVVRDLLVFKEPSALGKTKVFRNFLIPTSLDLNLLT